MADRVIVVDCGKVVLDGVPKEVFTNVEIIKEMGLDIPQISELFHELYKKGCRLSCDILDIDEAVEEIVQLFSK